jgi:hypothetical protein
MSAWTTAENNRTFFQVAAVAFLLIALQRRKPLAAFISGAFAGVALFFSFDIGLYTIAGIALTIAAMTLVARRCASEPIAAALPPHSKVLAWSVAGFFAGTAPFVVYLVSRGVFGDFLSTSFATIPAIIDAVWSLPFPDLVSQFRRDPNLQKLAEFVLQEKFRLILSPLTITVAAVYLLQRVIRGRFERLDQALLVLTIFAAIAQRSAFGRPDFRHQYFAAFLVGPMLVILGLLAARSVREIWRGGDQGARAFLSAIVLAALPLIAVVFWIPDLVNARIEDLMNYQRRVLRVQRDGAAEEILLRIRYVTEEIRRMTRRREPIFDFSNQPAFYFFADRMNPTRFYQVPIASPRQFQAEVIAALEKSRPKVVLRTSPERFDEFDGIPNSVRAQAVAAYLDDAYRFHAKVWGIEIWRRDPAAETASVEAYLRRIHLPAKDSIAADERARMVFPAVGSTPGANDSYWVSDLTLHNPFRESMAMSLRFIGPNARVDRRLTLAPRQTVRWPDVVKTFFGADGIGTLWIQHRQSRAPVAIVKTADIAHDARASVEFPLTDRDAVTANTENSELIVVGVPAVTTAGRRVNVGIVNTGRIPASFRISVRTRAGREIGRTVESGIPEDEVWTVPNIERELGVTLDETTTLRFTAIAGTGVGYATVIEPNGDSEFIAAHPAQGQ